MRLISAPILALFIASSGNASVAVDLDDATSALEAGDPAGAITAYEDMANEGLVNGHLFYNLGIAHFRAGDTGPAVAAFLAARRYLPRDPDVAANLNFALSKIPDKLEATQTREATPPLDAVLSRVTARELLVTLGILMGLAGLAMTFTLKVKVASTWRPGLYAALVLPAAVAGLLFAKLNRLEVWGAVHAAPKASVYSGPGEQNTLVFELHEGAPVLVTDRGTSGFLKIQLSDGKSGWIAGSQVKVFGPQFGAM